MSESEKQQAERSPIAERLSGACVGFRQDLEFTRHIYHDEPHYVIRDPMTFASHKVSITEYKIVSLIDNRTCLDEIFKALVEEGDLNESDEENFYEFVVSLHRIGFIDLPIPDESMLYQRHTARQGAERMQKLMSVFFMQIPLWNPSFFLDRTAGIARALFSVPALIVWLILQTVAIVLAIQNFDQLAEPIGQVLIADNLAVLWGTLIGLKLIHEFGHAWACKRFGGFVPEMGAYLIVFTPCAYVDATSAWGFSKKSERLIVSFAGMYFELAVAAIAMIVWCLTDAPFIESICYNVIVLASIATIVFNVNPLMKSDGYFALSDWLEVPNLRTRSTVFSTRLAKRIIFGVKSAKDKASTKLKVVFLTFGLLLPFYRASIVLGISMGIAAKLFVVGMCLALLYIAIEVFKISKNLIYLFFMSPETSGVRLRAAFIGLAVMVFIPLAIVGLPMPSGVAVSAVLRAENEDVVRAASEGFLSDRSEKAGEFVEQDAVLAHLVFPDLDKLIVEAEAAVASSAIRLRVAQIVSASDADQEKFRLEINEAKLIDLRRRQATQTLRSPATGVLIREGADASAGSWINRGQSIFRVHSGHLEARTLLSEEQFALLEPEVGQTIKFRAVTNSSVTISGVISRVLRHGSSEILESALTQVGGGEIVTDAVAKKANRPYFLVICRLDERVSRKLHGSSGRIYFEGTPESLGTKMFRSSLNLMSRLRHGSYD